MNEMFLVQNCPSGIPQDEMKQAVERFTADNLAGLGKVLMVVPDFTRYHSNAGAIAGWVYGALKDSCRVDLLVALGTHTPMTEDTCRRMYPGIPYSRFIMHNWRQDTVKLGVVPGWFVHEVSGGVVNDSIDVEVNRLLVEGGYDLILSIGQVVPHEVVGMANHSKNLFVGCGGASMINGSHMLGAFYGMERMMGRDDTPVRRVFDYAAETFLKDLPLCYALTVTSAGEAGDAPPIITHGLFIGPGRAPFERAVALAQQTNLTLLDAPLQKVVVYLAEDEFRSTWLGNKSIYRTRMAIADGGQLIVLAPGVGQFGEDDAIDALIRAYGYCGRENIIRMCDENEDLRANLSAAAHLIHGSSDGRFSITYCTRHLPREAVEGVFFGWMPYDEAAARYNPATLQNGFNTLPDGETVYYIQNPALGLWADKNKFFGEA